MSQNLLTGDRPTGPLHLGHLVGSLFDRVRLQSEYETTILVADVQALTDHADEPLLVRESIVEVVSDYLAVGIDPREAAIALQSAIPALASLTAYLMNLISLERLGQNPTVKHERETRGAAATSAGFACYPVAQAADILCFDAAVVPVGADQLPMLEDARHLRARFHERYGETFVEPTALVSGCPRLLGIDGMSKMSKSSGNAIFLGDSEERVEAKVMRMYTDPGHLRVSDPGRTEGNVVFEHLRALFPGEETEDLAARYERGGVGDVTCKRVLLERLQPMLAPIRERKLELLDDRGMLLDVLRDGTETARAKADSVLARAETNMGLDVLR